MSRVRPRRVSTLIKRLMDSDPSLTYETLPGKMYVRFASSMAWSFAKEDIDLPIVQSGQVPAKDCLPGVRRYFIIWDVASIGVEPDAVKPFTFDPVAVKQQEAKNVVAQEEDTAALIGGHRHAGSGAIEGFKSDASSVERAWQAESKQTKAKSFSVKLEVLDKITREARRQHRRPVVHLRFTDVPREMVAEDDWVVLPASVFQSLRELEDKFYERDSSGNDSDSGDD